MILNNIFSYNPKQLYSKKFLRKTIASLLTVSCLSTAGLSVNALDIKIGDVSKDGRIDAYDALLTLRQSVDFDEIDYENLKYADYDDSGEITSFDALLILRKSVGITSASISCPDTTAICGDRLALNAKIVPSAEAEGVTFEYIPDKTKSTDGSGCNVLEITNTGRIKAFHPGKSTVQIKASNGLTAYCEVTVEDSISTQTITVGEHKLNVTNHMMLKNDAYDETKDFTELRGIFVHSTATPGAMADIWYKAWNKPNTDAAVHAFLDDKGVFKYLPYEQTAWHAGKPANTYYLDFEICEPSGFYYSGNKMINYDVDEQQKYFDKIWTNATVYTAYLCRLYGLTEEDVLSHAEGAELGIATNHGDPDHWFKVHHKNMNDFRRDVKKLLENDNISITERRIVKEPSGALYTDTDFFENNDVTPFDMFKVWGNDTLRY